MGVLRDSKTEKVAQAVWEHRVLLYVAFMTTLTLVISLVSFFGVGL